VRILLPPKFLTRYPILTAAHRRQKMNMTNAIEKEHKIPTFKELKKFYEKYGRPEQKGILDEFKNERPL